MTMQVGEFMETIAIRGVWLLGEEDEDTPFARAVVVIELADGTMKRCISESILGPFSHYVHAEGIRAAPQEGQP